MSDKLDPKFDDIPFSADELRQHIDKLQAMDYRLDLANAVDKFQEQMTENDALFIICHNTKQGDLLLGLDGDVDLISRVLSGPEGYVKVENKKQKLNYDRARHMVLNIAISILNTDDSLRNKFRIAMDSLPREMVNP